MSIIILATTCTINSFQHALEARKKKKKVLISTPLVIIFLKTEEITIWRAGSQNM